MRWKRWIVPVLLGVAVAAAIAWGLRPQPVLVDTTVVRSGPLRVTVEEEGKTRVRDRYVVSSPITGRMERIPFDEGAPVRAGQRLTAVTPLPPPFLDPRTRAERRTDISAAESRIVAAQARVRAAKANADYWRDELDRTSRLAKSGDIPTSRYQQVLAEHLKAVAALSEAEAAVDAERATMRRALATMEQPSLDGEPGAASVPVLVPASGRILRVVRKSAGPVNAGDPLVEVGDSRNIEVEVELLSHDAVKVTPGTRVIFTRWGGENPLEGRVQRIEADGRTKISALGVEEQRVPVIVDITAPEQERRGLGAGYRVEASFVLWEADDVLQIPSSAVFPYDGSSAVFVVEQNIARRRIVKLGRKAGLNVELLEGVRPGERLVLHPDNSIDDGKRVQQR